MLVMITLEQAPLIPDLLPAEEAEAHALLDVFGAPRQLDGRALSVAERVSYQRGRALTRAFARRFMFTGRKGGRR